MVRYIWILLGILLMNPSYADGWAIAIHGGAGSNPDRWTEEEKELRREGMEKALQAGVDALKEGTSALETVETVIRILEDDAAFNAGRGAVLTEASVAELDASIMDGRTLQCGAVASVTRIKNPITAARHVMTETSHVLLVGKGAEMFAESQQLSMVDPDYFLGFHHPDARLEETPHLGTVGCVVLDSQGNLAAGTSTGGTPKKLPGRVGDSPIIGAGTYAANDTCAVSGTGRGEEYIRHAVAYDVAAQMRYANRSLKDSVTRIMIDVLTPGTGGLITVSHSGEIVMQHNTPGMTCAAADSQGRFEVRLQVTSP